MQSQVSPRVGHLAESFVDLARSLTRPDLDRAVTLARELRASGVAVTIVVHEHKRLGRGIELAALAEHFGPPA